MKSTFYAFSKLVDHIEFEKEKYKKLGTVLDSFGDIDDREDKDLDSYSTMI